MDPDKLHYTAILLAVAGILNWLFGGISWKGKPLDLNKSSFMTASRWFGAGMFTSYLIVGTGEYPIGFLGITGAILMIVGSARTAKNNRAEQGSGLQPPASPESISNPQPRQRLHPGGESAFVVLRHKMNNLGAISQFLRSNYAVAIFLLILAVAVNYFTHFNASFKVAIPHLISMNQQTVDAIRHWDFVESNKWLFYAYGILGSIVILATRLLKQRAIRMLTVIMLFIPLLSFGHEMAYLGVKIISIPANKSQHGAEENTSDKSFPTTEQTEQIWAAQRKASKVFSRFERKNETSPAEQGDGGSRDNRQD